MSSGILEVQAAPKSRHLMQTRPRGDAAQEPAEQRLAYLDNLKIVLVAA
jgi:hypothetical protein